MREVRGSSPTLGGLRVSQLQASGGISTLQSRASGLQSTTRLCKSYPCPCPRRFVEHPRRRSRHGRKCVELCMAGANQWQEIWEEGKYPSTKEQLQSLTKAPMLSLRHFFQTFPTFAASEIITDAQPYEYRHCRSRRRGLPPC